MVCNVLYSAGASGKKARFLNARVHRKRKLGFNIKRNASAPRYVYEDGIHRIRNWREFIKQFHHLLPSRKERIKKTLWLTLQLLLAEYSCRNFSPALTHANSAEFQGLTRNLELYPLNFPKRNYTQEIKCRVTRIPVIFLHSESSS